MAKKRLIGDDNSINTFDGKTDQIHGQTAAFGVSKDTTFASQAIAPQIPFSRCVPGPLSLRTRFQTTSATDAGAASPGSATSPGYSVTKDNTNN
jgi:hypothetical protein